MEKDLLSLFLVNKSVSTDTRNLPAGTLFFALKGEKFDGNQYAAQALDKGAAFAIIDNPAYFLPDDKRYILVADSLRALQSLGREYRRTLSIPVLGITGSNGKTTTKEIIASVLKTEKKVSATKGNLNNHIGVPLTLLSIPEGTEIAIVEMGANQPDDIRELAEIAEPTHGIITNIGKAHLERLKGIEGVKKVKGQLFDFIRNHDGVVFVNNSDANVVDVAKGINHTITFGTENADFTYWIERQSLYEMTVTVKSIFWEKEESFEARITGDYNAHNIVAAIAIGHYFGISPENLKKGIYDYIPVNHRSQIIEKPDFTIWMDAYNANPSSMKAAIRNIFETNSGKKIALILGDMFEMGEESEKEHTDLGRFVRTYSPVITLWVGKELIYAYNKDFSGEIHFNGYEDLPQDIHSLLRDTGAEIVLIKGSRGMALERLLDRI
ncbi:MAG: UDP-N-acetylmuramoyl-tripeptide--D-alanyl-D-alanine ligase [Bacteroidia bacterium]|nr:UDP-N-acetylmuramoyl-tripeptide--D-alanyl-D-alanine ligase [Bacteroidia bacterium]